MADLPLSHGLILAVLLFSGGLLLVLSRRNLIYILMGIEIMLNATGLVFVLGGARWGQPDGQVLFILVLTVAAAEVAVGLALVLQMYRQRETLDADAIRGLRE